MGKPIHIDDNNSDQGVLSAGRSVLTDFWGAWGKLSPPPTLGFRPKRSGALNVTFD